jgi:3'-phosphoadenosine 5'-phosphosulfate sulfotransferase (PAPS reductase)/FAD synthetase
LKILAEVRDAIADLYGAGDQVALLYSGGMESNLLLSLVTPWKNKTTVFTAVTGTEFPHMRAFIENAVKGWSHVVVEADLHGYFQKEGLPANVLPMENLSSAKAVFGASRQPHVVPWLLCCVHNRNEPAWKAIREAGITKCIHGQRKGDWLDDRDSAVPEALELFTPLQALSRQDVREICNELQVPLPSQYGELDSSLDCSVCPASLTPARRAYMLRHYPRELVVAEQLQGVVTRAVLEGLSGEHTFHNRSLA